SSIAFVIQHVINQLERQAQLAAVNAQRIAFGLAAAQQAGHAPGRGFKQHGGFAINNVQILLFGGIGVFHVGQLQHFAFGNHAGGLGQDLHHRQAGQFNQHFKGAAVQEVADQYAGGGAAAGVGGGV